jgi:hypothetical protein
MEKVDSMGKVTPKWEPNSLQTSMPATSEQIAARITGLVVHFGHSMKSEGEYRSWLRDFCQDLAGKTDAQLEYACGRYRRDPKNRFMPTPGQILELCNSPFADKPPRSAGRDTGTHGWQPWGGECECARCLDKTPSPGFYRAQPEEYRRAEAERAEMDAWNARAPSKLTAEEVEIEDLVRSGTPFAEAGVQVLIRRTRALYAGSIKPEPGSPGYVAALKAEVLARPPIVMTPELAQCERDLAAERADALARRVGSGGVG